MIFLATGKAARARPPIRTTRRPAPHHGRPVVVQGPDHPADAEGARRTGAHRATTAPSCTWPTGGSSSWRRRNCPTVNPGDDPARAIGTSDLPYRMEISWDQTYNDVYLVDLKTGKPQKVLEHWGSAGTALSPGGKVRRSTSTSAAATGSRIAIADGARVEPHREAEGPVPAGQRHAGPARSVRRRRLDRRRRSRCCSTTSSTSGRSSPTAPAPGWSPTARGASRAWSSGTGRSIPEERVVPGRQAAAARSAIDDRTARAAGFYRAPASTGHARAPREDRDARQGVRRADQGQERRDASSSRCRASRSSRICGSATPASGT